MEFCLGGSVVDLMRITQRSLSEPEIATILYQVLLGIDYLHQNKKIHRDIKAGNILLDANGCVKLADFGVAAQLTFTNADKVLLLLKLGHCDRHAVLDVARGHL